MHLAEEEEVEEKPAIKAKKAAKVEELEFNAVLHDSHDEDELHLRSIEFPEPMYGLAITAKSRGDEQKISDALHKIQAEDQSFKVEHNATLNETVITRVPGSTSTFSA